MSVRMLISSPVVKGKKICVAIIQSGDGYQS